MTHWQKLLHVATLLLVVSSSDASRPRWEDGVIVQKVDGGYLYLFPATQGRIKSKENPAGVINIGSSITVMYSLRLVGTAKTRFIGMDATRSKGVSPQLRVMKAQSAFGFFVRDTNQPTLEITIDPTFMQKVKNMSESQVRGSIASQGNLNVTLGEKHRRVVIQHVRLD